MGKVIQVDLIHANIKVKNIQNAANKIKTSTKSIPTAPKCSGIMITKYIEEIKKISKVLKKYKELVKKDSAEMELAVKKMEVNDKSLAEVFKDKANEAKASKNKSSNKSSGGSQATSRHAGGGGTTAQPTNGGGYYSGSGQAAVQSTTVTGTFYIGEPTYSSGGNTVITNLPDGTQSMTGYINITPKPIVPHVMPHVDPGPAIVKPIPPGPHWMDFGPHGPHGPNSLFGPYLDTDPSALHQTYGDNLIDTSQFAKGYISPAQEFGPAFFHHKTVTPPQPQFKASFTNEAINTGPSATIQSEFSIDDIEKRMHQVFGAKISPNPNIGNI